MIPCPYCASTQPPYKDGKQNGLQRYQCRDCRRKYTAASKGTRKPQRKRVIKCPECGQETTNPKFCSSSCAAKYNNRAHPKRKAAQRFCKHCGTPIPAKRTTCDHCNPSYVDWAQRTLGDIRQTAKYQAHAEIRDNARSAFERANLPRACRNCGYDKHVEICHIRAINSFPDDTPIAVINALDNLVALCPNCHWEFDHGLLKLDVPAAT